MEIESSSKSKSKVVDTKKNKVWEWDLENHQGISYPDQDIPENEKDPNWYVRNIHYISTFYNVPFQSVLPPLASNVGGPPLESNLFNQRELPVQQMIRNMTYYQGTQENREYNDWAGGGGGEYEEPGRKGSNSEGNYQPHWIKGHDISELLNHLKGIMLERIANLQITAQALSEEAISEREEYRNLLYIKHKHKDQLARLAEHGVQINAGPPEGFDNEQQIEEYVKDYKQNGVDVAMAIAKDTWITDHWLEKMLDLFLKTGIYGTAQMQHYVQNGKLHSRPLPSWQMIFDTRIDSDYNRDAQFVGFIETMTPTEIFLRYPQLDKPQRDEITKMAKTEQLGATYNTGFTNFMWWNYNTKRNEAVVSVATGYWIGIHDQGIKNSKNKFGDDKIMPIDKGEKGDYVLDDIYKGTLIGNRYLLEFGPDNNIVEDPLDKSKPMFPITRYMPNMVGGEPRSITSRFRDMQDEIDALQYMIRISIGRWMGKVYIVRGDVGNNTMLKEMYENWKTMGVTVIPKSGEGDDNANRILEGADFSLDPNIMRVEEIIATKRALMKEYASISNVSLGMQTTYMGMGERNSAIGQSSYGLSSLFHGFMDFIQMNLQYALNVRKNLLTVDGDNEAEFIVGNDGVMFLKVMEKMRFEDQRIILKLNDIFDEKSKNQLDQLALAWSQNSVIDPPAYLKVMKAQTKTDAEKILEYEVNKVKEEKQKEIQEQRQHEQQIAAGQAQALQHAETLRQAGQDNRSHINKDAKVEVAKINKIPEEAMKE